ncbi:hypothetical protein EJ110_NYTH51813 [Nymphaea thermarum]|nr:hypothetical protein EJ110_NYTH51813 [Nymphaea thermarum]
MSEPISETQALSLIRKNLAQPLKILIRNAPIKTFAELIKQANSIDEGIEECDFDGIVAPKYKKEAAMMNHQMTLRMKIRATWVRSSPWKSVWLKEIGFDPLRTEALYIVVQVNEMTMPHVLIDRGRGLNRGSGLNICPDLTTKALRFHEDKYRSDDIKIYEYDGRVMNNKVKMVHAFGNSQLIINQVNEEWQVKDEMLVPYQEIATSLICQFQEVQLVHIKREGNPIADGLANP